MRTWTAAVVMLLAGIGLAGCLVTSDPVQDADFSQGRYEAAFRYDGKRLDVSWAPGGLGTLTNSGNADRTIVWPAGFILVTDDRFLLPSSEGDKLRSSSTQQFLVPPNVTTFNLTVEEKTYTFQARPSDSDAARWDRLVSGDNWYALMENQQAEFPNRMPGHASYGGAVAYFEAYFTELGYDVEVDPFGTQALTADGMLCLPVDLLGRICPESLANVVATKPGTDPSKPILFVAGGHFDVVPATTHGAFDNTGGSMGVLELARALAPFSFEHTLMFALWGGEENGILGSQFWVQTNPQARAQVASYWNLDVIGMSWPAPLPTPDPVLIAAGPDVPMPDSGGATVDPVSGDLLAWAQEIQRDWLGFPDAVNGSAVFLYEGVASGQVDGYAGVNAQSDHTPFAAAGIPAYFIFNGNALASHNPVRIHSESDTLTNMTKYALYQGDFEPGIPEWDSPEDLEAGRQALARSIETVLYFPLYHTLLVETGHLPPANTVAAAPGLP